MGVGPFANPAAIDCRQVVAVVCLNCTVAIWKEDDLELLPAPDCFRISVQGQPVCGFTHASAFDRCDIGSRRSPKRNLMHSCVPPDQISEGSNSLDHAPAQ